MGEYLDDPTDNVIFKYNNHLSILTVKIFIQNSVSFSFQHVSTAKMSQIINMLSSKKAMQPTDIPNKLLTGFNGFFSNYIYDSINNCVAKCVEYVDDFKNAKILRQETGL